MEQRISEKDREIREKDQKIHKMEQEKQKLEQKKQKLEQKIDEGPRDFSRQQGYGLSFPFNIRASIPWIPVPVTADPLYQETNHATSQATSQATPNIPSLPHKSRQRKRQTSPSTKENGAKKKKAKSIKKETTAENIKKEMKTENIKREDD